MCLCRLTSEGREGGREVFVVHEEGLPWSRGLASFDPKRAQERRGDYYDPLQKRDSQHFGGCCPMRFSCECSLERRDRERAERKGNPPPPNCVLAWCFYHTSTASLSHPIPLQHHYKSTAGTPQPSAIIMNIMIISVLLPVFGCITWHAPP